MSGAITPLPPCVFVVCPGALLSLLFTVPCWRQTGIFIMAARTECFEIYKSLPLDLGNTPKTGVGCVEVMLHILHTIAHYK